MALNGFIGLLFVSLFLLGCNALSSTVGFVNTFVETYIDPTNPSFGVARFLYNNNILYLLIPNLINIQDIL